MSGGGRPAGTAGAGAGPPRSSWSRRRGLGLLLLGVVAAALRCYHLGAKSLWIDEATSVYLARLPWRPFLAALWDYEANMALYYVLLRGWLHLGDSEPVLRGLSAVFGVAAVPAIYVLARRLVTARAAMLAAVLLCVHVFHVWWSQEARSYALVLLLTVCATYLFIRCVEAPRLHLLWWGYVATGALAVYAHVFAALTLSAHWLSLGREERRRLHRAPLVPVALALLVLLAPLGLFVWLHDRGQVAWLRPPGAKDAAITLAMLSGNNPLVLVAAFVGLGWSARDGLGRGETAWRARVLVVLASFPLLAVLLVSFVKPLFFARYFAICLPFWLMAAARALSADPSAPRSGARARAGAIGLAVGVSVIVTHGAYDPGSHWGDWRSATEYMLARRQEGDALAFDVGAGLDAYRYYRQRVPSSRIAKDMPTVIFPGEGELASAQPAATSERIERALAGRRRLWLMLHQRPSTALRALLGERFRAVEERTFAGRFPEMAVTVALYERR